MSRPPPIRIPSPRFGAILRAAMPCCLALATPLQADDGSASPRVAILCGARASDREAAAALKASLERRGQACLRLELPKTTSKAAPEMVLTARDAADIRLVATVGARATAFALQAFPKTPVVFFRVPNALDAPFVGERRDDHLRIAGVTTDIHPQRQLAWIREFSPRAARVAILHSPRTRRTVRAFEAAAARFRIHVVPIPVTRKRFPEAIDALNASRCDGVLMIPDARVYNAATIKRLLLWGLRRKKAVWTFSANIVKAGALAGMYADPDEVVRQAAELIREIVDGADPKTIGLRYPEQVRKAVNLHTIRAIEAKIDDEVIQTANARFGEQS